MELLADIAKKDGTFTLITVAGSTLSVDRRGRLSTTGFVDRPLLTRIDHRQAGTELEFRDGVIRMHLNDEHCVVMLALIEVPEHLHSAVTKKFDAIAKLRLTSAAPQPTPVEAPVAEPDDVVYTDTVSAVDIETEQVVVTSAGGKLMITTVGGTYTGYDGGQQNVESFLAAHPGLQLRLTVNPNNGSLVLIACRGRGLSHRHPLGQIPDDLLSEPHFRRTVDVANSRLDAWVRQSKRSAQSVIS